MNEDGFTPITWKAFALSCDESWSKVMAEESRLRVEKLQTAVQYAREVISTNEECFVAQWVLQNQDKNIDDYTMCYQHCGDIAKFWMQVK